MANIDYKSIIETAPFAFAYLKYILDEQGVAVDFEFIDANSAFEELIGKNSEELIGKTGKDVFGSKGEPKLDWLSHCFNVAIQGGTEVFDDYSEAFNKTFKVQISLLQNGYFSILLADIPNVKYKYKLPAQVDYSDKSESVFLNSLAFQLAELSTGDDIIPTMLEYIKQYTKAEFAIFSQYLHDKKVLVVRKIIADSALINTIVKIAGEKVLQTESPVSNDMYNIIVNEQLGIVYSFTDVSFGEIPKIVDIAVRSLTGLHSFYGVAHVIDGQLYGTTMLSFKKHRNIPSPSMLKSYAHLAALSLRKNLAEKALKASEVKWKSYIENAPYAIVIINSTGSLIETNPAFCKMTGYSENECENFQIFNLISPDSIDTCISNFAKLVEERIAFCESKFITKTGDVQWWSIAAKYISDNRIIVFFEDISERNQSEKRKQFQLELQKLIAKISSVMTTVSTYESFDNAINSTLQKLGELFDVDRAYLFSFSDDLKIMTNTHEWCSENTEPQIANLQNMSIENYSWWEYHINNKKIIHIPDASQLGNEVENEINMLQSQDVVTLLCLPTIGVNDNLTGFLGFDSVKKLKHWDDEQITMLKLIADTIGSVTERLLAFDALRLSERRYSTFINSTDDFVFLKDENFRHLVANKPLADYFNLSVDEVIGRTDFEILPKEFAETCRYTDKSALLAPNVSISEEFVGGRVFESTKFPVALQNGKIGVGGFIRDITERKNYEIALKESEERLRKIVSTVPDLIVMTDLNGTINFVNDAKLLVALNVGKSDLLGQNMLSFISAEDLDKAKNNTLRMFEGQIGVQEYLFVVKKSMFITCDVHGEILRDEFSNPVGMVYVVRDISERKLAEKEIKDLNENLEKKVQERTYALNQALKVIEDSNIELLELNENIASEAQKLLILNDKLAKSEEELLIANQTKDKFFSIIAHDLKNPIGGIRNLLELIVNYSNQMNIDEIIQSVDSAHNATIRTFELLENLLEWSRLQSGKINYQPEYCGLLQMVERVVGILKPSADMKSISIEHNFDESVEALVDKDFFTTILRNLIANAIKYSYHDSRITIEVRLDCSRRNTDRDFYVVSVSDSGVGISTTKLNNLFKIEQMQSTPGTDKEKGTGLGLILCKEFVEKHGGKIWADSEEGKWSTFYFSFPK